MRHHDRCSPAHMEPADRRREVIAILSRGLSRLRPAPGSLATPRSRTLGRLQARRLTNTFDMHPCGPITLQSARTVAPRVGRRSIGSGGPVPTHRGAPCFAARVHPVPPTSEAVHSQASQECRCAVPLLTLHPSKEGGAIDPIRLRHFTDRQSTSHRLDGANPKIVCGMRRTHAVLVGLPLHGSAVYMR